MKNEDVLNIINQVKKGDTNAFVLLVDSYKDMVYSLCYKMTRSTEDSEEIAQDSFVKAFQGLKKFKGASKFSTWLYQITYFTAINFLRKNKVETTRFEMGEFEAADETILMQLQQSERKVFINKAFAFLKPDERALITLFYLEEKSMDEVAAITKMSLSNVKVKMHRTRKKLLQVMQGLLKNELHSLV